jgi:ABC-type proline/glycine betaine transport systems, ATPase components
MNIVHKDQYVSIRFIKENPLNKQVSSLFSEAELIAEYFMIEFQNVSYAHSKGYGVNNLNMTIEDGDSHF